MLVGYTVRSDSSLKPLFSELFETHLLPKKKGPETFRKSYKIQRESKGAAFTNTSTVIVTVL